MARIVKYAGYEFEVRRDDVAIDQIQASMSDIFPELRNAYIQNEGDVITFIVKPKYIAKANRSLTFNHFYSNYSSYDGVIIDDNRSALVLLNKNEEWY